MEVTVSAALYVADMASKFGDWLDARIAELEITQAELSRQADVSQGQLSRYRNGTTTPDPGTLRKLAAPLKADYEQLMILAGYAEGDAKRAGRTFVVSTDDPKVHRLYRIVGDVENVPDEKIAEAEAILKVLFQRKGR
jgi:transcriptional regulator with XRE-family HTH domain